MLAAAVHALFRNLTRNLFASSLDIAGLAIGLAAALVIALYVLDELTFDAHLPDVQNVLRISSDSKRSGVSLSTSQKQVAELLTLDYPQVTAATRLLADTRGVRHGSVESNETLYWADPNFFSILSLPAVAGDPKAAFANPRSAVVTQRIARKYFGREAVLGETLQIDRRHEVVIGAVLADLPPTTHLATDILLPGSASFSSMRTLEVDYPGDFIAPVHTYIRVAPGMDIDRLRQDMPAFIDRHWGGSPGAPASSRIGFTILPVRDIHLGSKALFAMQPAGDPIAVASLALVALLIVIAACVNFVNLAIARASRRSLEVGIRKCNGAGRWSLAVHFAREGILMVGIAFLFALLLVWVLLPPFSAVVGRDIGFRWMERPWLIGALLPAIPLIGVLASAYPAAILSSFRPASVLRTGLAERGGGSSPLRRALIVIQFAILTGLLIATGTIVSQMRFAIDRGTGVGEMPIVVVRTNCPTAFVESVRQLRGVREAACSQSAPTNFDRLGTSITRGAEGTSLQIDLSVVDFDFFSLYGLKPLAGRVFSRDHTSDSRDPTKPFAAPLVLNETAVRKLGFKSPAEAVGAVVRLHHVRDASPSTIIGVVPDFPVESLREPVGATAYYIDPDAFRLLSIRLERENLPATLDAIDRAWDRTSGTGRPIDRFFIDDYLRDTYAQMRLQLQLFTALSVVAITIAAIGLFGLAALTAQRRTREIGIRKALGAHSRDIVEHLVWEFAKPVLWANLIAWPVAEFFLRRWLETFAYHIEMPWWLFVGCSGMALIIALAVVLAHATRAARARPIYALRYE